MGNEASACDLSISHESDAFLMPVFILLLLTATLVTILMEICAMLLFERMALKQINFVLENFFIRTILYGKCSLNFFSNKREKGPKNYLQIFKLFSNKPGLTSL